MTHIKVLIAGFAIISADALHVAMNGSSLPSPDRSSLSTTLGVDMENNSIASITRPEGRFVDTMMNVLPHLTAYLTETPASWTARWSGRINKILREGDDSWMPILGWKHHAESSTESGSYSRGENINELVDVNVPDANGDLPVHVALESADLVNWPGEYSWQLTAMLFHNSGIDLNQLDGKGRLPLIVAIETNKKLHDLSEDLAQGPSIISVFLGDGTSVDVNKRDGTGCTPLIAAIRLGDLESFARLLVHPDIDYNKPHADGTMPLVELARSATYLEPANYQQMADVITELRAHPQFQGAFTEGLINQMREEEDRVRQEHFTQKVLKELRSETAVKGTE